MIINLGDTIRDERGREGVVTNIGIATEPTDIAAESENSLSAKTYDTDLNYTCLLYTSPSPRDKSSSRMPSSA